MKRKIIALLLALLCLAGCGGEASQSLTGSVKPARKEIPQGLQKEDAAALTEFSLSLLRENWTGENILLSPLSVLSALGMTANGAQGDTLAQMEAVLGLPAERLNEALAAWAAELPGETDCRVSLANSLWLRDGGEFEADPAFLQTAADWYGAEVFASRFDGGTVRDVNSWVKRNTGGMIPEILEEIPDAAVLYLINALALEAEWKTVYRKDQVRDRTFTAADGTEQPVELMYSSEGLYLRDEGIQGFLKPYAGGRWAFGALLPEEGLEDFLAGLTGERLHGLLEAAEETRVEAAVPKFECRYGANLAGSLEAMGMQDAFDAGRADFSCMGTSSIGPLFISAVLHRTCITVDERGTRAGAATAVEMSGGSAGMETVPTVYLNRPFLYMLVDRETNLPAFIGAVTGF